MAIAAAAKCHNGTGTLRRRPGYSCGPQPKLFLMYSGQVTFNGLGPW